MPEETAAETPRRPRPAAMSAACAILFLALAATLLRVAARWTAFQSMAWERQLAAGAALAVLAATLVAYWRMRRWGVWLLGGALLVRLAAGPVGILPLRLEDVVLPALVLAVGALYWRRMH